MAQTAIFQDGVTGGGTFKDGSLYSAGSPRAGNAVTSTIGQASVMGGIINYRTIIQMGLDEVPDNAIVTSGVLTVNVLTAASATTNSFSALRSSETDWTEDGSHPTNAAKDGSNNWATAGGSVTTPNISCGLLPASTGSYDIDITGLVRDAVENRSKVLNIVLKDTSEGGGNEDTFVIKTGDNSTTADRPKLTVNYVEGGGAAGKARARARPGLSKRNRKSFRG